MHYPCTVTLIHALWRPKANYSCSEPAAEGGHGKVGSISKFCYRAPWLLVTPQAATSEPSAVLLGQIKITIEMQSIWTYPSCKVVRGAECLSIMTEKHDKKQESRKAQCGRWRNTSVWLRQDRWYVCYFSWLNRERILFNLTASCLQNTYKHSVPKT